MYDGAANSIKNKLNSIQNSALRIAVGALRRSKISKLEVEANVPSLQLYRDYMSFSYGIKILADRQHPTRPCLLDHKLFKRSNAKPFSRRLFEKSVKYRTNIYDIDNKVSTSLPPWINPSFNIDLSAHTGKKSEIPIVQLKTESLVTIQKYKNTEHFYTDRSVCGE